MCCEVPHVIELTNIKDNSLVTHELVLIKGTIRKTCYHKELQLKVSSSHGHIFRTTSVSLGNGDFKILHRFEAETEEFHISYCSKSIKFKCRYVPPTNPYKIQPLYIICKGHDGAFNASGPQVGTAVEACAIIDLNIKLLQCLYAEKLNESGFGRKTFSLQSPCQIFESNLEVEEAWASTQEELWNKFAYEVINSEFGNDAKVKYVVFIGCTKYERIVDGDFSYENIKRHMKGNAALGGGGLALFGSGFFYSWPSRFEDIQKCFANNEKVDLERFADESNYRRTYAGVYATSLGAVCHEIGHIFDLGHTKDGIMGNGFDYLNRVFTIDCLTESLPNRVIEEAETKPRFTKVKRDNNQFLEKYHEQKSGGDSFFFSRNCAVILAYHRWLGADKENNANARISFDKENLIIRTSVSMKLVEIRSSANSLVVDFFEFPDAETTNEFKLPRKWDYTKHYMFVICVDGTAKRLDGHMDLN